MAENADSLGRRRTRLAELERRLYELERDHDTARRVFLVRIEELAYVLSAYRHAPAAPSRKPAEASAELEAHIMRPPPGWEHTPLYGL